MNKRIKKLWAIPILCLVAHWSIKSMQHDLALSFPLLSAAQEGNCFLLESWIKNRYTLDIQDTQGCTALIYATCREYHDAVALLLFHKALPEQANREGNTPLIYAAQKGNTLIISLLLLAGAQPEKANLENNTPLIVATAHNQKAVVAQLLQQGVALETENNEGNTALAIATLYGHTEIAQLLLTAGACIHFRNTHGYSPFMNALYTNNIHLLTLLSHYGASLTEKGPQSETPLICATYQGHRDTVTWLLDQGADIDACNDLGCSPLMVATYKGHLNLVQLLLDRHADIELSTHAHATPLLVAIDTQNLALIEQLLAYGANIHHATPAPTLKGKSSRTQSISPHMLATKIGNTQILTLLEQSAQLCAAQLCAQEDCLLAQRMHRTQIKKECVKKRAIDTVMPDKKNSAACQDTIPENMPLLTRFMQLYGSSESTLNQEESNNFITPHKRHMRTAMPLIMSACIHTRNIKEWFEYPERQLSLPKYGNVPRAYYTLITLRHKSARIIDEYTHQYCLWDTTARIVKALSYCLIYSHHDQTQEETVLEYLIDTHKPLHPVLFHRYFNTPDHYPTLHQKFHLPTKPPILRPSTTHAHIAADGSFVVQETSTHLEVYDPHYDLTILVYTPYKTLL